MVKKSVLFLLSLSFAVFLISLASAEVWFVVHPESTYSVGDDLRVSIAVSYVPGQLEATLYCANESKPIFLKYLINETSVEILQPLTKSFLGDIKGMCRISAEYGADGTDSLDFLISNSISIDGGVEKQDYSPGEVIIIRGKAKKADTLLLNGFFELSFPEINFTTSGTVENGKFETNLTLPDGIVAGGYLISLTAYEKEGEEISNIGNTKIGIRVKQVPKKIDIAINNQNLKPGNNLSFKIELYDQSGMAIEGEASFLIENSKGDSILQGLTKINEENIFSAEKNLSFGYYTLKAHSSGLYGERQFYVEENQEAEFKIYNTTLAVINVGNVKYNKAIQVKIGDKVEIINDELGLGEEKRYEILAPDGTYDIVITDGNSYLNTPGVGLTGNVVAIRNLEKGFFSSSKSLAWYFLILVFGMFIVVYGRKVLKKKFVLSSAPFADSTFREGVVKAVTGKGGVITLEKEPREAEHSLVLKGQKQDAAVICLKIKNELSKVAKLNLDKILERAYENKGVIYKSGEYTIPIFSPLVTRTFKNHAPAVRAALDIAKKLQDYNDKFKEKIEFGIAVHSGDIVNRVDEGKLKFTGLGNTLPLAKKLAEISQKEVLLSREIHEKTLSEIKADKINRQGLDIFVVKRVTYAENNAKFIGEFLKRQEGSQKKSF